jgi:hypothetical protein
MKTVSIAGISRDSIGDTAPSRAIVIRNSNDS